MREPAVSLARIFAQAGVVWVLFLSVLLSGSRASWGCGFPSGVGEDQPAAPVAARWRRLRAGSGSRPPSALWQLMRRPRLVHRKSTNRPKPKRLLS
jgi:hypothetical protein